MGLFDTHCHLYDQPFADDLDDVLGRAEDAGVERMVVPGIDVETSRQAIALAERYEGIYAAVGVHPESLDRYRPEWLTEVRRLADHPKVVAIGEIGLDYYWNVAPKAEQQAVFLQQIDLARELGYPIIIHNRDATEDTVRIVEESCSGVTGVMHCFTGSIETAKQCIRKGFYISFGGPVTFKNAENVRRTAAQVPDEWLLVETDSPYLSPHPHRGQRNEPARVAIVAQVLAEVRGCPVEELATMASANARRLFPRVR